MRYYDAIETRSHERENYSQFNDLLLHHGLSKFGVHIFLFFTHSNVNIFINLIVF